MRSRSRRTVLTLVGGAVLLGATLLLADLFALDVLLVLFVPFVALVLAQVRPVLHWTSVAVIAASTVTTLVRVDASGSSTAGLGVVVVPLLLTVGVLLVAVFDRVRAASIDMS
jgi:hypothetical protein